MADWINSLPGTPALPPPTINPEGGSFTGSVTVTMQSPNPNATVYYTLDGSLPTTNSIPYATPFNLTNTATVSASAFESSFVNSVAPSYLISVTPGISFLSPGLFTNGWFEMQVSGLPNRPYVFQTSTDLMNWSPLFTNSPVNSPFSVIDSNAANFPLRFYRTVQQP
jgi:hypothetical protein